jgi:hypothetical protein
LEVVASAAGTSQNSSTPHPHPHSHSLSPTPQSSLSKLPQQAEMSTTSKKKPIPNQPSILNYTTTAGSSSSNAISDGPLIMAHKVDGRGGSRENAGRKPSTSNTSSPWTGKDPRGGDRRNPLHKSTASSSLPSTNGSTTVADVEGGEGSNNISISSNTSPIPPPNPMPSLDNSGTSSFDSERFPILDDGEDPDSTIHDDPDSNISDEENEDDSINTRPSKRVRASHDRYDGPAKQGVLAIMKRLQNSTKGEGSDQLLWKKIRQGELWINPPNPEKQIRSEILKGLPPNPVHYYMPKIFVWALHESHPDTPFHCINKEKNCRSFNIGPKGWVDSPRFIYGLDGRFLLFARTYVLLPLFE